MLLLSLLPLLLRGKGAVGTVRSALLLLDRGSLLLRLWGCVWKLTGGGSGAAMEAKK